MTCITSYEHILLSMPSSWQVSTTTEICDNQTTTLAIPTSTPISVNTGLDYPIILGSGIFIFIAMFAIFLTLFKKYGL